ncbi:MAG: AEC family transporter [Gammaproteobacteria bacterium]
MTLFSPLITIFFVVVVGIFCYRKKIFHKTQIDGFELLLFKIIMPSYLFAAAYQNDLSALLNTDYIAAYLLTFGILALIVTVIFVKSLSMISVCMRILSASYVNAAIYVLPVISIFLKDPTAAIIGNMVQVIIIQPLFMILLNTVKNKEKSMLKKIISIVTTPLIIMPILGILLNYLQIRVPIPIVDAMTVIGSGASSLALFVFGLTLGATKITAQCLKFDLISVVLVKSVIHPLIAVLIAYYMKLETYWFNSLLIAASAPTAVVVYIISKEFSSEEEFVKKVVALTSVVAMVSLILITIIIG